MDLAPQALSTDEGEARAARAASLIARLRVMVRERRIGAARPLLAAVAQLSPTSPDVIELQARVLALEGRFASGIALLDAAIASGADGVTLRLCRAELRLHANDAAGATADAAEALNFEPASAPAKACLGVALIGLGRHADALTCLRDAMVSDPDNASYRQALAQVEQMTGASDQAVRTLDDGIARAPRHLGLRIAAIMLAMHLRRYERAAALAEAAQRDGVADACVLGLLGHARSSLGRHDLAATAYAEARKLAPEDPYVRHLAAAAGLAATDGRAAPEYVETVFDGYATRFDAHLISLGYRVPGLLRAAVAQLCRNATTVGPVLDLGCGTGLVAVALSDLKLDVLVGVDLSSGMLAQASARGLYAELHHSDIGDYLAAERRCFPLVLAGDVLPYFGDLAPICGRVAACVTQGGHFLFTVEELAADSAAAAMWTLGRLGRFAHTEAHIRAVAAASGLAVGFIRRERLRQEGQAPVPGLLVCLEKKSTA